MLGISPADAQFPARIRSSKASRQSSLFPTDYDSDTVRSPRLRNGAPGSMAPRSLPELHPGDESAEPTASPSSVPMPTAIPSPTPQPSVAFPNASIPPLPTPIPSVTASIPRLPTPLPSLVPVPSPPHPILPLPTVAASIPPAPQPEAAISVPPVPEIATPTRASGPPQWQRCQIEVWTNDSTTPQRPIRQGHRYAPAYVTATESALVRLQFETAAAGQSVIVNPGPGVTVDPPQRELAVQADGSCLVSVSLTGSFRESDITFYYVGNRITLPLARALSAPVATTQSAKNSGR
jgi:hypothetical protein